jgi:dTDP-4-amino-4,6-dideoxygalactose transaminase
MRTVPFYDVRAANAPFQGQMVDLTAEVLAGGHVITGPRLEAFEAAFAQYCGVEHCIGVGNGLDGLSLALRALGVGPGDEVIVPAFTFIATWFAVSLIGALPVPVDVTIDGNIDVDLIEAVITPRTRAIVPVHLFGRLAEMDKLLAIASAHGLRVVEDAAQAHGAMQGRQRAGSFGDAAAFSFYPTKNLGAIGDGGAVVTRDPGVEAAVRRLRNYGGLRKYEHEVIGTNSRLDELQAGYLGLKLPMLDRGNDHRRNVARRYLASLGSAQLQDIALPAYTPEASVWHLFVIRSGRRDALRDALARAGVGALVHYPAAPFEQPCYAGRYDPAAFPIARELSRTVLSLPMGDYLSEADVDYVIDSVTACARRLAPVAA